MDVLLCLARCSGNLVTRQDLIDTVWATEFISDNTLTHAIAELRSALGCDAMNPSYIETVHRRGYRLLVGASEADGPQTAARQPSCFYVVCGDRGVRLTMGENLIGRIPWATVTVDSVQVSRRHAQIGVDGSTALLKDLGSKNGTYLNGRPLKDPAFLSHDDRIGLGSSSSSPPRSRPKRATRRPTPPSRRESFARFTARNYRICPHFAGVPNCRDHPVKLQIS